MNIFQYENGLDFKMIQKEEYWIDVVVTRWKFIINLSNIFHYIDDNFIFHQYYTYETGLKRLREVRDITLLMHIEVIFN